MADTKLYDNFGRPMEYMRLAVTDRCNLRCFYCMPPEGVEFVPRKDLLSYEDMLRLTRIMVEMGVNKVRITGGEPFVRKNMYGFLKRLAKIEGLEKINITTNGAVANRHIPFLKDIGIDSINLSLDTLDRAKYKEITHRDFFNQAMSTYKAVLDAGMKLKVNMVVMADKNIDDITPMAMLTKEDPVAIRYIEEMPFNGVGGRDVASMPHDQILNHLQSNLPPLTRIQDEENSTSANYSIEGHKGTVGVIAGWSRTFCNSCNRIRVTATGQMINCLYDKGSLDLKHMLSDGSSDAMIKDAIAIAYKKKFKNGLEAEKQRFANITESMSRIGG
ncbi:MAG: GTP 3',8-cyclase MoaA [Bacteroidota bacterium]